MKDTKRKYKETEDGKIELATGVAMKKETYQTIQQYRDAYVKDTYRQFNIKINKNKYADVIDRMEAQENLVGYLVKLIRADMAAEESSQ